MFRSQMKAESIDSADQFCYPCYVSEKLDGWRCLIVENTMYTSGGKEFKPPVQERFRRVTESAHNAGLVIDGELFIEGNSDFGLLSSTLSASVETMAERGLKFHCFDAITYDEWHGHVGQEPFDDWLARYVRFCQQQIADYLIVPVEQHLCKDEAAADAYYQHIKAKGGEGVMMRVPYGKYEPNRRSKDIVKRKVWNDCSDRGDTSTGLPTQAGG